MLNRALAFTAGVFLAASAMPAVAAVQDASGAYRLDASHGENVQSGNFSSTPFVVSDAFTTITVLGQSQPSISVVSVEGQGDQSNGFAALTYFFRYQAADIDAYNALLNTNALLNFAGLSTITDSWGAQGEEGFFSSGRTEIVIRGANGRGLDGREFRCGDFRQNIDGCGTNLFSIDQGVNSFADAATLSLFGSVRLIAFSENGGDGVQLPFSSAFIDPIISLRGNGLVMSRYTLELSNGIGNGGTLSAVPEPASWAMMLTGFGLAGGALRRRGKAKLAIA